MSAESPRERNVGRPPRFSLDVIISAADRLLQTRDGKDLSMRHLAYELGSSPMALYYHVRDKDELLLLVLDKHAQLLSQPELPDSPRERIRAAAFILYDLLADHPWALEGPVVNDLIPPSALWIVEVMIDAAVEYGYPPEQAVDVYRTIWYYIVGSLIIKTRGEFRRTVGDTRVDYERTITGLGPGVHPRLAALAGRWAELTARDTHTTGLIAIIDGLLPPSPPHPLKAESRRI